MRFPNRSYVSRLTVKNFQRHESYDLELDPKVTVVVGESTRGKSALMRGLRFVALGKAPKDHVTWGKSKSDLSLWVDGVRVRRVKGKGVNYYRVGKAKPLKAFGAGKVPDPVARLMNLDENNFQRQHEPFFTVFDSPPQIAKSLNRIANLEDMDRAIRNSGLRRKRFQAELDVIKSRLADARRRRDETAWAMDAYRDLRGAVGAKERHRAISHRIAQVATSLKGLKRAREGEKAAQTRAYAISEAVGAGAAWVKARKRVKALKKLLSELKTLRDRPDVSADLTTLDRERAKADEAAERRRGVEVRLTEIRADRTRARQLEQTISVLEKKLSKIKRCPLCGSSTRNHPRGRHTPSPSRSPTST